MISLEDSGERISRAEALLQCSIEPGLCLTVQLPPPLSGAEWGNFGRF
uniref:Uncharacterized protein n=1 Tax=Heterorhabditis bacteriophora TaxID=37862 RepID=A0A1I7WET1_HETBA